MQAKSLLLAALIASIKLVFTEPLGGLLGGLLGGGNKGELGGGNSNVNPDGLLHPLNPTLGKPLCAVGLGCKNCNGLLSALNPLLGSTVNSVGLGIDCGEVVGGGVVGDVGERNRTIDVAVCSLESECEDCDGTGEENAPICSLGVECEDCDGNEETDCGCGSDHDWTVVPIVPKGLRKPAT